MFRNTLFFFSIFTLLPKTVFAAADSYRWFHVTIETPWAIFLFLLPMVLLPAVIMAILYWKYAGKKINSHTGRIENED